MFAWKLPDIRIIKKIAYCLFIVVIIYFFTNGYQKLGVYLFYLFLGITFYEAEHFNIRFVIVLVGFEEIIAIISEDLIVLCTRIIFKLSDFTTELFLLHFVQAVAAFLMIIAIFRRQQLIRLFRLKTGAGRNYKMLFGMEWLVIMSYFSVIILHVVFFINALPSIIEVTDFKSYHGWWGREDVKDILFIHRLFYMASWTLLLFAIQSYNYKKCLEPWSIKF